MTPLWLKHRRTATDGKTRSSFGIVMTQLDIPVLIHVESQLTHDLWRIPDTWSILPIFFCYKDCTRTFKDMRFGSLATCSSWSLRLQFPNEIMSTEVPDRENTTGEDSGIGL